MLMIGSTGPFLPEIENCLFMTARTESFSFIF